MKEFFLNKDDNLNTQNYWRTKTSTAFLGKNRANTLALKSRPHLNTRHIVNVALGLRSYER